MGWKDWPYWLKGVIISAIITIIIVVIITSFYIIRDKDKPENQKGVFYLPDLIPSLIGIFLIILIILILIENFRKGRYSLFFAVLVGFLLSIVNIFVYGIIGIPFAMPLIVIFESLKICYGEECWGWGIIIGSLVYIILGFLIGNFIERKKLDKFEDKKEVHKDEKEKRYWLKFGLIFLIFPIFFFIGIILGMMYYTTQIKNLEDMPFALIVSSLIIFFLIGAIIGYIYGKTRTKKIKIKSRNN